MASKTPLDEPLILCLAGVFLKDCKTLDEIAIEKYTEVVETTTQADTVCLPSRYEGRGTWPTTMTAQCPMCGVRGDRAPITMIITLSRNEHGVVFGNHNGLQFNLWTCLAFFIQNFHRSNDVYKHNATWFYEQLEGRPVVELPTGIPPWEVRECGIGTLSRREWISANVTLLERDQAKTDQLVRGITYETPTLTAPPTSDIPDTPGTYDDYDEFDE